MARETAARPGKVAVVEEIRAKLAESDATVLTEYRGLTVSELAALRASLRPTGTEYKVFKNTLARRAIDEAGVEGLDGMFEGPVALAFVRGDAVPAAKALRDFGKSNPALVLKAGLLGSRVLTAAELDTLADVAPRDVLLAQIAGTFQAPLTKAAGLFQAFTRNLAYGVQALIDQRVASGEAAAPAEPAAEAEPTAEAEPEPASEPEPAPEAEATPESESESE
jgi:large subunit ribosomal protein L10